MNAWNFLIVLLICVTLLIIADMITKKGITITRIYKDITDKEEISKDISEKKFGFEKDNQDNKEDNKEETQEIAQASMDAVIKAANELMGIEVEEDVNNAE